MSYKGSMSCYLAVSPVLPTTKAISTSASGPSTSSTTRRWRLLILRRHSLRQWLRHQRRHSRRRRHHQLLTFPPSTVAPATNPPTRQPSKTNPPALPSLPSFPASAQLLQRQKMQRGSSRQPITNYQGSCSVHRLIRHTPPQPLPPRRCRGEEMEEVE